VESITIIRGGRQSGKTTELINLAVDEIKRLINDKTIHERYGIPSFKNIYVLYVTTFKAEQDFIVKQVISKIPPKEQRDSTLFFDNKIALSISNYGYRGNKDAISWFTLFDNYNPQNKLHREYRINIILNQIYFKRVKEAFVLQTEAKS
jgi:hypothetical protein